MRRFCCVPSCLLFALMSIIFDVLLVITVILVNYKVNEPGPEPLINGDLDIVSTSSDQFDFIAFEVLAIIATILAVILTFLFVANIRSVANCTASLFTDPRKYIMRTLERGQTKSHNLVSLPYQGANDGRVFNDRLLQVLKGEVQNMAHYVGSLDMFTKQQTRFVIIVDGLDAVEQSNVLAVLDSLNFLCGSQPDAPFIMLLAIDPHVITKAIEMNISTAYTDTSVGGYTYLKNVVHLPFFLQNAGLRRIRMAERSAQILASKNGNHFRHGVLRSTGGRRRLRDGIPSAHSPLPPVRHLSESRRNRSDAGNLLSMDSVPAALDLFSGRLSEAGSEIELNIDQAAAFETRDNLISSQRFGPTGRSSRRNSIRLPSSGGLNNNSSGRRVFLHDHYLGDINPRSMRRLTNIVYIMGRLMRAFSLDFDWYRLSTWVNMTEQWPYRMSWIILVAEKMGLSDDNTSLYTIYKRIKHLTIAHRDDLTTALDIDRDERKLETYLHHHGPNMCVIDLRLFLPFAINLDPYLRKAIREQIQRIQDDSGLDLCEMVQGDAAKNEKMTTAEDDSAAGLASEKEVVRATDSNRSLDLYLADNPLAQSSARLSKLTVGQVVELLQHSDMSPPLSAGNVGRYAECIVSQNINGIVLARCDLLDLKAQLNMTFGDWEMFKYHLVKWRKLNIKPDRESEDVQFSNGNSRRSDLIQTRNVLQDTHSNEAFKTQIDMEDAMISQVMRQLSESDPTSMVRQTSLEELGMISSQAEMRSPFNLSTALEVDEDEVSTPQTTETCSPEDSLFVRSSTLEDDDEVDPYRWITDTASEMRDMQETAATLQSTSSLNSRLMVKVRRKFDSFAPTNRRRNKTASDLDVSASKSPLGRRLTTCEQPNAAEVVIDLTLPDGQRVQARGNSTSNIELK